MNNLLHKAPSFGCCQKQVIRIATVSFIPVGGGSILWKVSQWQPVEKLLTGTSGGRPIERGLQCALVDKLTDVCTYHGIDPDQMDQLLASFDEAEEADTGTPDSHFVNAMLDFFSTHMKMQE